MSSPLARIRNELTNRSANTDSLFPLFREWMNLDLPAWETGMQRFWPAFDVKETTEGFQVKADVPGVKEGDLEVSFQGGALRIQGKREAEREEKNENYYYSERSYGAFNRTLSLPETADGDKCRAELKDGVLNVFVPRKPGGQAKKVDVKVTR